VAGMKAEELKVDPFGLRVGHTWCEIGLILDAINRNLITRFVEIGLNGGGLCAMLSHTTEHLPNFHYLGVEEDDEVIDSSVRQLFHPLVIEQDIRQLWIMDARDPMTIHEIAGWIRRDAGPALVYCDGGKKAKEFNLYAPILRKDDLIATHDFDFERDMQAEIRLERSANEHHLAGVGFVAPYRISLWRKDH